MTPDTPAAAGDKPPLYDFCLWPYEPQAPLEGRRPFADLLAASFALAPEPDRLHEVSRRCVADLGPDKTVWGVKWDGTRMSWELYFYDYARQRRRTGVDWLLRSFDVPAWRGLRDPAHLTYFMVSVELDGHGRFAPSIDLYLGASGGTLSAGRCHALDASGLAFKHLYYFYDARRDRAAVLDALSSSVHLPAAGLRPEALLWPELAACQTLVVAHKRQADGLYYSRTPAGPSAWFLRRMGFPAPLPDLLASPSGPWDHLLFDLGVDFRLGARGVEFFRGAFYGVV